MGIRGGKVNDRDPGASQGRRSDNVSPAPAPVGAMLPAAMTRHLRPHQGSSPPARTHAADRLGAVLEETVVLERDVRFLEEGIPPLQARLDAATRPVVEAVVEARRAIAHLVERRILSAPSRERRFVREATELLRHLAADLEERFGVVLGSLLLHGRSQDQDPDEDGDSEPGETGWRGPEPEGGRETRSGGGPRSSLDPEGAARGIYRSLARELHPDKTTDADERVRRTSLMQDLSVAWRDRDLPNLLRLLHAHGSDEARADALDEASLAAALRGVEENRDRLRARLRELRHSFLPGGATDWAALVRDPKLFERVLRRERRIPREELEQVLRLKAVFARPGGLEEFLDEVPWEDWPSVL